MNYSTYHEQLFPGDPVLVENPLDADASVDEIIAEVSCATGIKASWLQRSAREVMEGLAGLGCLWFLHGAHGTVAGSVKPPAWVRGIASYIEDQASESLLKQHGLGAIARRDSIDWGKGLVHLRLSYYRPDNTVKTVNQSVKMGKHVDAFAESKGLGDRERLEMHHELKWRGKADHYEWRVSCHPYDVLTMSFDRPWPSCMKPGGLFEFGPLTDMAAGSAIIWFTRPGADAPCGRLILRPYAASYPEGKPQLRPGIASGGRLYGEGPTVDPAAITEMLGTALHGIAVENVGLCGLGAETLALTRGIYSDVERYSGGCKQDMDLYADAYINLSEVDWPEANLAIKELSAAAAGKGAGLAYRGYDAEGEDDDADDAEELANRAEEQLTNNAREIVGEWFLSSDLSLYQVYATILEPGALTHSAGECIDNIVLSDGQGTYQDLFDVRDTVDDSTIEDVASQLQDELCDYLIEYSYWAIATFTEAQAEVLAEEGGTSLLPFSYETRLAEFQGMKGAGDFERAGEVTLHEDGTLIDDDSGEEIALIVLTLDWMAKQEPEALAGCTVFDDTTGADVYGAIAEQTGLDRFFHTLRHG